MIEPKQIVKLSKNVALANLSKLGLNFQACPLKLTLALTYRCNLKCKICGIWKIYRESPEKVAEELTLEDYSKLFSSLNNWNLIYLEFTGGEPFLRSDIDKIIAEAGKKIKSLKLCILTTNGFAPNQITSKILTMLDFLPSKIQLTVGVSLDGTPAMHDYIRGMEHAYDNALKTFVALQKLAKETKRITPHISYTINSYNAGKLQDFYNHLKSQTDMPLNKVSIALEHQSSFYNNQDSSPSLSSKKISEDITFYLNTIKIESTKINVPTIDKLRNSFYSYYANGINSFLKEKISFNCAASTLSAFIDPYGNIYPCTIWNEKIGNIKNTPITTLWDSPKNQQIKKQVKKGKCPRCWTPCEIQPSILLSIHKLLISSLRRTNHNQQTLKSLKNIKNA